MPEKRYNWILAGLLLASFAIRAFIAAYIELGNDEVYYWTYALYPDWSHFDHPPMVGWFIRIFSFNLLFQEEFFLRLASILAGTLNTYLVYRIGREMFSRRAGLISAFLYTSSLYGFVVAGTFILPDTPQILFWLLALLFFVKAFKFQENRVSAYWMIAAGILTGCALLSKYTSAFLLVGVLASVVFHSRKWLLRPSLYISLALSALLFLPVILWNIQNHWISFTFQGERVNMFSSGIRLDYFLTELGGQFFYNNPVNVIIYLVVLAGMAFRRKLPPGSQEYLLLWTALPLIFIFLVFSLFRQTLPHWSAPGYLGMMLLAGGRMDKVMVPHKLIPVTVKMALVFMLAVIIAGLLQIKTGLFYQDADNPEKLGKKDVSLDMYGWEQTSEKFRLEILPNVPEGSEPLPIISYRWFPAANIDYYIARPLDMQVLAIGDLEKIHKYAWINRERRGFRIGMDAWFLTSSRDFKDPALLYPGYFREITPVDTLAITRGGKHVYNVFVYLLKNLQKLPTDPLKEVPAQQRDK